MSFELIAFASGLIEKQAVQEVVACNQYTSPFGLVLTQTQATELVQTRLASLQDSGRIEFGGGVTAKLIRAFCDSPYLSMQSYAQTLHDLTGLFYYYKNETMDLMTDDELIAFMKTAFDGVCQGSLELLAERELYRMATNLRSGLSAHMPETGEDADEESSG